MKTLIQYISEKLIVNKNYKQHIYFPKSWKELRELIVDRFEKFGPGTKNEPINFNDIDVSGMTTFYNDKKQVGIFEGTNFVYIDVSNWDVSNVTDMNSVFWDCTSLKKLDLSNWDVFNVEDMAGMFCGCKSLKELDLSNWDVSNVGSMNTMFDGCKKEIIPDWYEG